MNTRKKELKYFRRRLLSWYAIYGRKFPWRNKYASNYQIIVAEVLLQRTKAESVAKIFVPFLNKYPTWGKLAAAEEEELSSLIKPLGLWKRRTHNLLKLSNEIVTSGGLFPKERESIEKLTNVGQYIANAVMLFCHDIPLPLLDTNMARVLERYFGPRQLADIRYDPYLQALAKVVVKSNKCKELNWAILDYASMVCRVSKPRCNDCMLEKNCLYYLKIFINQGSE